MSETPLPLVFRQSGGGKKQGITKTRMAEIMKTSRAQVDRLLSASDSGATLDTLSRAAQAVGRTLLVELT